MFRKLAILATAFTMMFMMSAAPSAQAQCTVDYNGAIVSCDYPAGGLGNTTATTPKPTPQPTSSAVPSADNVKATASDTSGGAIAFTGSESRVLGYVGAGLIGTGAIALVAARRKSEADLD